MKISSHLSFSLPYVSSLPGLPLTLVYLKPPWRRGPDIGYILVSIYGDVPSVPLAVLACLVVCCVSTCLLCTACTIYPKGFDFQEGGES